MASTKRKGPSFSPPKPRKTTARSSTRTDGTPKPNARTSTSKVIKNTASKPGKKQTKSNSKETNQRKRSRLVSPTPSASDSLGGESEEDSRAKDDDDDDEDETNQDDSRLTTRNGEDSPEPDFILAEVTHEEASSEPPIPYGLVHRILHSQFTEPEKTKISTDAREMVGKYIEVFVREAIMRCAYEKNGDESGSATNAGHGGWLELEDLEKVAVQLCLDF